MIQEKCIPSVRLPLVAFGNNAVVVDFFGKSSHHSLTSSGNYQNKVLDVASITLR